MPVKLNTSEIKIRLGIQPNGRVDKFLVHTCKLHMDKYLPYDTGTLAITPIEEQRKIRYIQKYAYIVYNGYRNGKAINYHLDKHPLAGPKWDKRMITAEIADVLRETQRYVKRRS